MFKKVLMFLVALGLGLVEMVKAEPATVQSTAVAAAGTLVTNAGALLIIAIAIPVAFAGYAIAKAAIRRARG